MAGIHPKGRVGEDGITRYYDPSKHAWVTVQDLKNEAKAAQIINIMTTVSAVILGGGGLLWMIVQTFS